MYQLLVFLSQVPEYRSKLKMHASPVGRGTDWMSVTMQSFFTMWWPEQSEQTQKLVTQLVKNKQLGFVNGGQVAPLTFSLQQAAADRNAQPYHEHSACHRIAPAQSSACCECAPIWRSVSGIHLKAALSAATLSLDCSDGTHNAQLSHVHPSKLSHLRLQHVR